MEFWVQVVKHNVHLHIMDAYISEILHAHLSAVHTAFSAVNV